MPNRYLETLEERVERDIDHLFGHDPEEVVSHTLCDPRPQFFDMEARHDTFGLRSDIPPFSGSFDI